MLDGMILQSYHHTFEPISKACFQSGFTIETICEPRPEEKDKNSNPEAFLETRDHPIFVIFKCKLTWLGHLTCNEYGKTFTYSMFGRHLKESRRTNSISKLGAIHDLSWFACNFLNIIYSFSVKTQ